MLLSGANEGHTFFIKKSFYESLWDSITVTSCTFSAGEIAVRHSHKEGQFAYVASGGISMLTDKGNWVIPARRAIWVPPNIGHEMHMLGAVTMLNMYLIDQHANDASLPPHCQVFEVSDLLHQLLNAILPINATISDRRRRINALLLDELSHMPSLPLSVPLPEEGRLLRACKNFLSSPKQTISIDEMASLAAMSRRNFTRQFREGTGMSFVSWRQHACILEGVTRLNLGVAVKDVSISLDYSSTSAFCTAFRSLLGDPPSKYISDHKAPNPIY